MKTQTSLHLATLAANLTANGTPPQEAAQTIHELHRLGKALHARYVAACNYQWADTPAYEKRTENLKQKLIRTAQAAGFGFVENDYELPMHGLYFSINTDPRGWPVILSIGGRVDRVGGEV